MEILNPKRKGPFTSTVPEPLCCQQLPLERAVGAGPATGSSICYHSVQTGALVYPCGGALVCYDTKSKVQSGFFRAKRPIRALICAAFSKDGRYIAAGEKGNNPQVLVWELSNDKQLHGLKAHKYGISCLAFSNDGRLLVSTGYSFDGQICVWDIVTGSLLCRQNAQAELYSLCFADDGNAFITVGKEHFKAWAITSSGAKGRVQPSSWSLVPKPASLQQHRSSTFVAVAATPVPASSNQHGPASVYALTKCGTLLLMRPTGRSIDKAVNLQVPAGCALAVTSNQVACGCTSGVVRLFAARTLAFLGNLPRPSTRGQDLSASHYVAQQAGSERRGTSMSAAELYPDAVACSYDVHGDQLAVMYSDRSLVIWDTRNPTKVARLRCLLSHAASIWDAALLPAWQVSHLGLQSLAASPITGMSGGHASATTQLSSAIATCSSDGSMRVWSLPASGHDGKVTRALKALLFAEPTDNSDVHSQPPQRRTTPDTLLPVPGDVSNKRKDAPPSILLRCLKASPDGRHLACGDARGNLRVYNLQTMQLVVFQEAHDAEILTLAYSPVRADGSCYLASGSKDMLIHVYDVSRGYALVGTCEDHSAAVTAVRFALDGQRLISCGADRCVIFRHVRKANLGLDLPYYQRDQGSRGMLYDLAVDPLGKVAVTVGQEGQIRVFDLGTGKLSRTCVLQQEVGISEATRITLDASGQLAVCACVDGSVCVFDMERNQLLARGAGHSEMATAVVITEDCQQVVSTAGDGCIFTWRLPADISVRMQQAAARLKATVQEATTSQPLSAATPAKQAWDDSTINLSTTLQRIHDGKPLLSTDKLPKWAQRQFAVHDSPEEVQQPASDTGSPAASALLQDSHPVELPASLLDERNKWGRNLLAEASKEQAASHEDKTSATVAPAMAVAAAPDGQLQSAAASPPRAQPASPPDIALPAAALFSHPSDARPWAEHLEDDDEIVYCEPLDEDETMQYDVVGNAGEPEPQPESPPDTPAPEDEAVDEEPASGHGSFDPAAKQKSSSQSEEDGEDGEIKRDLFREHFGELEQASCTKPARQDERRQSLSAMYRQARNMLGEEAGPQQDVDANQAPLHPLAGTPYLAKVAASGNVTTQRGAYIDAAGGVTSALWTPDKASLPLMSPHLATPVEKTGKQLTELQKMKERLRQALTPKTNTAKPPQDAPDAAELAANAAAPTLPAAVAPQANGSNVAPGAAQTLLAHAPVEAVVVPTGSQSVAGTAATTVQDAHIVTATATVNAATTCQDAQATAANAAGPAVTTNPPTPGFSQLTSFPAPGAGNHSAPQVDLMPTPAMAASSITPTLLVNPMGLRLLDNPMYNSTPLVSPNTSVSFPIPQHHSNMPTTQQSDLPPQVTSELQVQLPANEARQLQQHNIQSSCLSAENSYNSTGIVSTDDIAFTMQPDGHNLASALHAGQTNFNQQHIQSENTNPATPSIHPVVLNASNQPLTVNAQLAAKLQPTASNPDSISFGFAGLHASAQGSAPAQSASIGTSLGTAQQDKQIAASGNGVLGSTVQQPAQQASPDGSPSVERMAAAAQAAESPSGSSQSQRQRASTAAKPKLALPAIKPKTEVTDKPSVAMADKPIEACKGKSNAEPATQLLPSATVASAPEPIQLPADVPTAADVLKEQAVLPRKLEDYAAAVDKLRSAVVDACTMYTELQHCLMPSTTAKQSMSAAGGPVGFPAAADAVLQLHQLMQEQLAASIQLLGASKATSATASARHADTASLPTDVSNAAGVAVAPVIGPVAVGTQPLAIPEGIPIPAAGIAAGDMTGLQPHAPLPMQAQLTPLPSQSPRVSLVLSPSPVGGLMPSNLSASFCAASGDGVLLGSVALEDLTDKICQQYSEKMSRQLEERLEASLIEKLVHRLKSERAGQ